MYPCYFFPSFFSLRINSLYIFVLFFLRFLLPSTQNCLRKTILILPVNPFFGFVFAEYNICRVNISYNFTITINISCVGNWLKIYNKGNMVYEHYYVWGCVMEMKKYFHRIMNQKVPKALCNLLNTKLTLKLCMMKLLHTIIVVCLFAFEQR